VTRKDVRELGRELLYSLTAYEAESSSAGAGFVEIQHTLLFAAVGQKA
jgi:hypothetical protein